MPERVASLPRRGRGSQRRRRPARQRRRRWRPFLGGDEDRNSADAWAFAMAAVWRPFLGGDEDRNPGATLNQDRVDEVASLPRRGRGSQHRAEQAGSRSYDVASLPRRGRGSQPGAAGAPPARLAVASLPRRGRGSQLLRRQLLRAALTWRPFLGGDEDRNFGRIPGVSAVVWWRPFLGGDEDRNHTSMCSRSEGLMWRPFLGGDEDRNHVLDPSTVAARRVASLPRRGRGSQHHGHLGSVASRRVASLPRRGRGSQLLALGIRLLSQSWRPFLGGDEDRNSCS